MISFTNSFVNRDPQFDRIVEILYLNSDTQPNWKDEQIQQYLLDKFNLLWVNKNGTITYYFLNEQAYTAFLLKWE